MSSNLFNIFVRWSVKSGELKRDFRRINGNTFDGIEDSDHPLAVEWRCLRADMAILSRAMYRIHWETVVQFRHVEMGKNER
jgi:hypothetical protein